jgi:hypothetical protein
MSNTYKKKRAFGKITSKVKKPNRKSKQELE